MELTKRAGIGVNPGSPRRSGQFREMSAVTGLVASRLPSSAIGTSEIATLQRAVSGDDRLQPPLG